MALCWTAAGTLEAERPKLVTKRVAEEHKALKRDGVSVVVAATT
jgi:hypothetical protein